MESSVQDEGVPGRLLAPSHTLRPMDGTTLDEHAALVALLRERPQGMGYPQIAGEVLFAGSAQLLWSRLTDSDSLLPDPAMVAVLAEARADVTAWLDQGLRFVSVLDGLYPERLREIREVPPFLFAEGDLRPADRGMSVVGSRKASEKGVRVAQAAAEMLAARGLSVIAGLAAGIDTAAHRAALRAGGRTVALIGTGVRRFYPAENRSLQEEIAHSGLVLSQFWPDAHPTKHSFPMRNASMSGYGLATIVVEAGETSGTRIQARLAVEHGRPVILTDSVVDGTRWGAALVGRPGVQAVRSLAQLEAAIQSVVESEDALHRALAAFPVSA